MATENDSPDGSYGVPNREHMRQRPGMYIGGADLRAAHYLIAEVIGRQLAQLFKLVRVVIQADGSIMIVCGDARIPDGPLLSPDTLLLGEPSKRSSPWLTDDKFLALLNALSSRFEFELRTAGKNWYLAFEKGVANGEPAISVASPSGRADQLIFTFQLDPEILQDTEFRLEVLAGRFVDFAALLPGLSITVQDERSGRGPVETTFLFQQGLPDYLDYLHGIEGRLFNVANRGITELGNGRGKIEIAFAFLCDAYRKTSIMSFVDTTRTPCGGSHESGLMSGIADAFNSVISQHSTLFKTQISLTRDTMPFDIVGIVQVVYPDPQFSNISCLDLDDPEVETAVRQFSAAAITEYLNEHINELAPRIRRFLGNDL